MSAYADRTVLIVDDDSDVRGALAALLELNGYAVREADNGRTALEQLRTGVAVRLILLDLFMPDMNGWMFRAEQTRDPHLASVPVVVMSADPIAAQQAVTPGVVAAITKPIELDHLLRLLESNC